MALSEWSIMVGEWLVVEWQTTGVWQPPVVCKEKCPCGQHLFGGLPFLLVEPAVESLVEPPRRRPCRGGLRLFLAAPRPCEAVRSMHIDWFGPGEVRQLGQSKLLHHARNAFQRI